jgi:diguanylate cyclase (GGDEF)-like protein
MKSRRSELPGTAQRADTAARRLNALWRISTGAADRSPDPLAMVLAEAAAVIRPGQPFAARLCRVDGDGLVVEAAVGDDAAADPGALLATGARIALTDTPYLEIAGRDRTFAWDDLRGDREMAARPFVRQSSWRALITAPFEVGSVEYMLSFLSPEPAAPRFASDDESFVEIVAGYVERGLQQQWQSERLRFQMQHDPLTGLINRSQFRARVRGALGEAGSCGLIVVDVVALRELNERLGHQTGDALLVEVGAALCERNRDGEFTGRLYGGSFGICLPRIETRAALERRVAAYAQTFDTPFSTGDRAGTERVELRGALGAALVPDDAHGVDELIACAEDAVAPVG